MKTAFERVHEGDIVGSLTTIDRMIVRGHLRSLYFDGMIGAFLKRQGVEVAGFGKYVEAATERVVQHVKETAAKAGRPYIFQRARMEGQDERARAIAKRDGIEQGLVCVFGMLESASCFGLRAGHIGPEIRKCLHLYAYLIDPEFGLMHVKIQTWLPFTIQVWVNGRAWLARRLDEEGIKYFKYENTFLEISDLERAKEIAASFGKRRWWRVFDAFARRMNPLLPVVKKTGCGGYYWSIDQCEIATDVMWKNRTSLAKVLDDLYDHASRILTCKDVVRFFGAKVRPRKRPLISYYRAYPKGDAVIAQYHPEGRRVKHWFWRNSIKMYDKWSVLRVETTINRPNSFKVFGSLDRFGRMQQGLKPMTKNLRNLWRFLEVGEAANHRYLEAMSVVRITRQAHKEVEALATGHRIDGRRIPKINVLGKPETDLFRAVLSGEHAIQGFRNKDLQRCLYGARAKDEIEAKRRCARISRTIRKLRGHGLVAKVPGSRLYRTTLRGHRTMACVLRFKFTDAPEQLAA